MRGRAHMIGLGRPRLDRGFTLIELMVVIVILGIAAGYAVTAYTGATDEQKLHSAVREFVGMYRELRAFAAKERRYCVLELDLENGAYRKLIYPFQDTMGNYIDSEEQVLDLDEVEDIPERKRWTRLEKGIFLTGVQAPGPHGNETFTVDYYIEFRADGTIPPHILYFATSSGLEMSLEVEELTGRVTVREGHVEFYSPQEEEFDNLAGGGDGR